VRRQVKTARLVHQNILRPLKALLVQGISPGRLAASMACGMIIGVFPLVGTTTAISTMLAIALRLNLLTVQLGNWLMLPVQVALIPPFLMAGERIFGTGMESGVARAASLMREDFMLALQVMSRTVIHAAFAWALFAPFAFLAAFALLLPAFRRLGDTGGRTLPNGE